MLFFKQKKIEIPCNKSKVCLFEYGMSDRDIEGMPFPKQKKDRRACPKYGHICPAFMEDFNLSVDDLNIRSTIHCGFLAKDMIEKGKWNLNEMDKDHAKQIKGLLKRFDEKFIKFPPEKYPQYYNF